jgi:hypothetical protein
MFTQSLLALNSNSYVNYLITDLNGLKKKNQFIIITVSHFVTFLSSNFLKFEYGVYPIYTVQHIINVRPYRNVSLFGITFIILLEQKIPSVQVEV